MLLLHVYTIHVCSSIEEWQVYGDLSHLGSSLQQQAGTVRMSLNAGFMEWSDVVHRYHVDRYSTFYQLFELQGPAVGRCFMQGSPICPETLHIQ